MATLATVTKGLVGLIKESLSTITVGGSSVAIKTARHWPQFNAIQECARKQQAVIGVIDRGVGSSDLKFWPVDLGVVTTAPGAKSTLNKLTVAPGDTFTLTVGLADGQVAIKTLDAVSLIASSWTTKIGAVGIAVANDDAAALAQKLLADIVANEALSLLINVSRSGSVLTVTNISPDILTLQSDCANIATLYTQLDRSATQMQVVVFAGSIDALDVIQSTLEIQFQRYKRDFGFQLPAGENVRVMNLKAFTGSDKDTPSDIYRCDFLIGIDYPVIDTETLWPVLVGTHPISNS